MKKEILAALYAFRNIKKMILQLPTQLWVIFLPDTIKGLALLETNLIVLRKREETRNKVMAIQKLCGFPLRPNASLRETKIKARLQDLKRDKKYRNDSDDLSDEE